MAYKVRLADYFNATVRDEPGAAYRLLSQLAEQGVSLLAFTAVPIGPAHTQLTLFPAEDVSLTEVANKAGIELDGPYGAILVQGSDKLGALAGIHAKLFQADVNIYSATGIADGKGGYGYVLYVRPDEFERATAALGI